MVKVTFMYGLLGTVAQNRTIADAMDMSVVYTP